METKESIGHSVLTPQAAVEDAVMGTSPKKQSNPEEGQSRIEAASLQHEQPHGEKNEENDEKKDEGKLSDRPTSLPRQKSLPSIGSPVHVQTATKQTIHVIRRKPVGGPAAPATSQTWPQPHTQSTREPERERRNADDDEHNFKFCVVVPPAPAAGGPEEKIVAPAPEEKILVMRNVQAAEEKILVVDRLPHRQDADKIVVGDGGGDGLAVARPATSAGEDGADRQRRQDDMFGSAARELGLGFAHITGSVLKATAAGPTLMSRSLERSQSNISNSGSKKSKDGSGYWDRDKASIRSEPREPRITGWKSGMTAAGTVCLSGVLIASSLPFPHC